MSTLQTRPAAPKRVPPDAPRVGLFVTCLVDTLRPSVGWAAVKLLEAAGCRVSVPLRQTCCGQPAWNSGDRRQTQAIARQVIDAFADFDYIVAPSGSCAGMLAQHFPALFEADSADHRRALALARKSYELLGFLAGVMQVEDIDAEYDQRVTYHDSCSSLREMASAAAARQLLGQVKGLQLTELEARETCCGFGGTFCVKYPEISNQMVAAKAEAVQRSGAQTLLAADLGCLINIAGKLQRDGATVEVRHVAEVLAGTTEAPPLGKRA